MFSWITWTTQLIPFNIFIIRHSLIVWISVLLILKLVQWKNEFLRHFCHLILIPLVVFLKLMRMDSPFKVKRKKMLVICSVESIWAFAFPFYVESYKYPLLIAVYDFLYLICLHYKLCLNATRARYGSYVSFWLQLMRHFNELLDLWV